MKTALLALLLALPVGAEERVVIEATEGVLHTPDGGAVVVGEGAYLPAESLLSAGKELATLRAENEALKAAPPTPPAAIVVAVVVGVLLGLAGGISIDLVLRR